MSDSIVSCKLYRDIDNSIKYYEVTFSFGGLDVLSGWNPIYVYPHSMTNPTDLEEVRTLACLQATATKALFSSAEEITTINGPVSL